MPEPYSVQCFNCLSDFDAAEAIWCSCNPQHPSKVCPFCLGCFCAAGESFKTSFWREAPAQLRKEIETLSQSRMLIGEMLVRSGIITTSQLLDALTRQKQSGRRLGEILVETGALPLDRLERFLGSQQTVTSVDLSRARVDATVLRKLGVDLCLKERILPLEAEPFRERQVMTLVMADPSNSAIVDRVMQLTGCQVIPGVAAAEAIVSMIRSIFPQGSATTKDVAPAAAAVPSGDEAPRRLLEAAVKRRCSHIHIQNHEGTHKLHYRIDGMLYRERSRPAVEATRALKSFKSLAGLDTEPRLVPRVGRMQIALDGIEHELIVRSRPGREGEELSVKILDPVSFPPRLDELGLPEEVQERLHRFLSHDGGLLVVSSPPLSGASSTCYALVLELASQGRRLALMESPRAVHLDETAQEEFFPEIRNSFREALTRALLTRPSALVITAAEGVALNEEAASLSEGMLVVCRVEARTLPEALLRLARGGYPPARLASAPALVLHQRLLRRVCPSCRAQAGTAADQAGALGLPPAEARKVRVWRGAGCTDCAATPGFRGRVALAQALVLTPGVAEAVATGSLPSLQAACRAAGLGLIRTEALAALDSGLTTPEEIARKQVD